MSAIHISGGYRVDFRDDGIAISHAEGGLHMAGEPERAMIAEIVRLRRDLDDTIVDSLRYRAERDEVIAALRQMLHKGMIYGREHWEEVIAARAVLDAFGDAK